MDAQLLFFFVAIFRCLANPQPLYGPHQHVLNRDRTIFRRVYPFQFDIHGLGFPECFVSFDAHCLHCECRPGGALLRTTIAKERCGITEVAASRVVSGDDASLAEWPWQAWTNITGFGFTCGGSLITPEWVLTAGHCIIEDNVSKYLVTVGDVDRTKKENSEQTFKVRKIIKHPLYGDDWPYNNDVALLHLSRKAKITPFVKTVCFPEEGEEVPIGSKCFISGWGQMLHPGTVADILQQAEMPIVSNGACAAKLDTSPNGGLHTDNRTWAVTNKMLCAGDAGKTKTNGCFGDSGGPFVCETTAGQWVLQGVVSWGDPDCSSSNHYSVFARVSQFVTWIQHQIDQFSYKA